MVLKQKKNRDIAGTKEEGEGENCNIAIVHNSMKGRNRLNKRVRHKHKHNGDGGGDDRGDGVALDDNLCGEILFSSTTYYFSS